MDGTEFSVDPDIVQDTLTAGDNITIEDESGSLVISATDTTYDAFTGTDGTAAGTAGLVPAPATTDAGKVLGANGSWVTGGPNVVQVTGTSQTDVMSQEAVSKLLFPSGIKGASIAIGQSSVGPNGIALGSSSTGANAVAIGRGANAMGDASLAFGRSAYVDSRAAGGIALGAGSNVTQAGEINVSSVNRTGNGYNGSDYRLISGLYDGQSAHDAATKGQLDSAVNTIDTALDAKQDELTPGTGISIAEESGALVISATGAQIATINAQDWSALWQ